MHLGRTRYLDSSQLVAKGHTHRAACTMLAQSTPNPILTEQEDNPVPNT